MAKLKLTLDELQVESFHATDTLPHRGTVNAHSAGGTGCDTADACCMAGTHGGYSCDSTCYQRLCTCMETWESCYRTNCNETCQRGADTCYQGCETYQGCPTGPDYPGCY